tara:strand:+ start:3054 stop:4115 length:1062 start_codon:yes stop_codon:yes gene_type:complete
MKSDKKFFGKHNFLPVDEFFLKVLYDKKIGYYSTKKPFGAKGDYITAPRISKLFCEAIAIWMISTWENFGKPKCFNIVELGPGDGELTKSLLETFKKFPKFNNSKNIYLYEISEFLKKRQRQNIKSSDVEWIKNFNYLKKGPVIFFGNEFFDAIPIKQFKRNGNLIYEKYFEISKNKIYEKFKKASKKDVKEIKSFRSFHKLKFIEYPKLGLKELRKIIKKILQLKGCLLLIDYGYMGSSNQDTLQSVFKHKKNEILKNLGKADITSQVNFELLSEFFLKNNLKIKKIITQKEFLEKLGIVERANILAKKMKFRDQSDLYLRLRRLLSPGLMGNLFKVILAYNHRTKNYFGFK